MSNNSFRPRKFEDFQIVDANMNVVGHNRIKPSGILWAPKHSKVWYGISQKKFAELLEEHGRKQKK